MKNKIKCTKKEIIIVLGCFVFMLLNFGAIGSGGRRRAKEMVCLSNLHQWGSMFELFTNDNNGYFNRGLDRSETGPWMGALEPYYKDNWALLMCPEATNKREWGTFAAWQHSIYLPERGESRYVGSYGINSWTNNMTSNYGFHLSGWSWKNVQNISNKKDIPVFLDSIWSGAWPTHIDSPPVYDGDIWVGGNETKRFCINRHNGGINSLFMDWSVRKVGLKELWTLKWHRAYNTEGPWTRAGGVRPEHWPEWMRNFKEY